MKHFVFASTLSWLLLISALCQGDKQIDRSSKPGAIMKDRWFFSTGYRRNKTDVEKIKSLIDVAEEHGLNGMVLSSFGLDRITAWRAEDKELLLAVADHCKKKGIELIPTGLSAGYGGGVLDFNRSFAAALPVTIMLKAENGEMLPSAGKDIFVNGSLEKHEGNRFPGFAMNDAPGKVSFADSKVAASGKTSIRFENFTSGGNGHGRMMQLIKVRKGVPYRISLKVKTQDLEPVSNFKVLIQAGGRSLGNLRPGIKASQDWTEISLDYISPFDEEIGVYAGIWKGKSGKFWLDDFRMVEYATPADIARREGTPLELRSLDRDKVFVEGKDFETIPCKQNLTSIKLPKDSAIRNGERLALSCYKIPFVALGSEKQVGLCMSNPGVYEFWKAEITALHKVTQFKRFLLSMDEIRNGGGCELCRKRNLSMAEIYGDCVSRQYKMLKALDPDMEVMVWSDMLDPAHNSQEKFFGAVGSFTDSWKYVPRDITIMCWNHAIRNESLKFFSEKGFPTFGAAYYDTNDLSNPKEWLTSLQKIPGAQGIMYTSWRKKYKLMPDFGDLVSGRKSMKK